MLMYPAAMAGELVRFWRDFMSAAPDEVGSGVAFLTAPPADFVPEPVRGQPIVGVIVCYAGPVEQGHDVLAPLLQFGPPAVNMVQPMPYTAVQQMTDEGSPDGMQNYWTGDFLAELPDEAVDALTGLATRPVSPLTQIILMAGGGAIARVPDDATAFGERRAPWNMHLISMWADPADTETNISYTRSIATAMGPWTTGRTYLNFIGDEGTGGSRRLTARRSTRDCSSSSGSGIPTTCSGTTRTSRPPREPRLSDARPGLAAPFARIHR
jgi:hypothetical protein